MAIKANLTSKGLGITDAYVRIDRIFGSSREGWNSVIGVYANAAAAVDQEPVETFNLSAPFDDKKNVYAILYAALKSQARFAGAIDA
jgi:hypothetical protein